jgi:hypothetical protein
LKKFEYLNRKNIPEFKCVKIISIHNLLDRYGLADIVLYEKPNGGYKTSFVFKSFCELTENASMMTERLRILLEDNRFQAIIDEKVSCKTIMTLQFDNSTQHGRVEYLSFDKHGKIALS